jgi:o-succinylbenzoate synthase
MKITAVDIYRFCIPFIVPIRVGSRVLDVREGFILVLTDEDGRVGYGEVAPLPGLDKTTLDQCRRDIVSLRDRLIGTPLCYGQLKAAAPLLGIASVPMDGLAAHAWFGAECALFGLFLQQNSDDQSAAAFHFSFPLRVSVNGLFVPDQGAGNVARQIRELKDRKVKTVKVKIGRMAADEEIRQILGLADQLGSGSIFRLDGNRSLTIELYRRYYEALRHLSVEYAEEPLSNGDIASAQSVPWPVALDESLDGLLDPDEPSPSSLSPAVRTIILKPGLLNGLHAIARCITDAKQAGIKTVLSSSFNTGFAVAGLGLFSFLTGLPPETVHGLDTLRYLAADVLVESPVILDGQLIIPESLAHGGQHLNNAVIRREGGL